MVRNKVIHARSAIEVQDVVEIFIRNMIKVSENPCGVLAGIHNAFVHGEVLDEIGFHNVGEKDELLSEFYDHYDKAAEVMKKIEELNT